MKETPELQSYKDAVWDFMLEHCDITERGSFFIKFHASDRRNFENRILARWKYGYHRKDDRSNFDNRQKERDAAMRRQAHEDRKVSKRRQHMLGREERLKAMEELKKRNEEAVRLARMPFLYRVIHKRLMQPLAQQWYNLKQHYGKIAK